MSWEIFERAASSYEDWYSAPRGQRADWAEQALLEWLVADFPGARHVLEVGCGTGHFTGWLAGKGLKVVGLDRAPAMLEQTRRWHPGIPVVLSDGHRLPFRDGAVDLTLFVATLEFLDDPEGALAEAVRVARQGLLVIALNRWSTGGISRRWGRQARQPFLGRARDHSLFSLRVAVEKAAGERLEQIRWTSTLFPACLWRIRGPVPFGEVIGMAAGLCSLQYSTSE